MYYLSKCSSPSLTLPAISDSEGAQGAARRECATAKLHRRHPDEHHRAASRTAGSAQVREKTFTQPSERHPPIGLSRMIDRRRASRKKRAMKR